MNVKSAASRRRWALAIGAAAVAAGLLAVSSCANQIQVTKRVRNVSHVTTPLPNPSATPTLPPTPSPSPSASPKPTKSVKPTPAPSPTCVKGTRHAEVEKSLAAIGSYGPISVDGKQSTTDCATIKNFQRRMGIVPADGRASATTANVAARIAATDVATCEAGTKLMACVDLTNQTFYIMNGGSVVLGPTVTRTGMPGFATPTGTYKIFERSLKRWSYSYHVYMPYWQNFNYGIGLHETTTYIHNMPNGSHGCINLLHVDAKKAYSLLTYGSLVRVFGHRPGT